MEQLKTIRRSRDLSQRELARRSGLSFRGVQLLEEDGHDARVSSLAAVAGALGTPRMAVTRALVDVLSEPPESAFCASLRVLEHGDSSWRVHLFDFVDAMRRSPAEDLVARPPDRALSDRLQALFAASVESLCRELGVRVPSWTAIAPVLREPWFVAGYENLMASALLESPLAFRSRNVFVLANFLARA